MHHCAGKVRADMILASSPAHTILHWLHEGMMHMQVR